MDRIMEKNEGTGGTEVIVSGFTDYRKYKTELDGELTRAAQSFVRIGFLLRVAEDTDILRESGYRNVTEFAAAEYGLDKSQVSRFININIQFSENGYSDYLQERYERFGYAKLAIMLSLPGEINEVLPDSLSKADIQAVADEVKAEFAISDIEMAIEKAEVAPVQPEGREASLRYQAAARLCREQQELFCRLWYARDALEVMQEILAPSGSDVYMVRVPGMGRLMIVVRDKDTSITVVRTCDTDKCSTEEFVMEIWKICQKGTTPEEAFRQEFGEGMENPEGSPSGKISRPAAGVEKKEPQQRRTSKVTKARKPETEVRKETPVAAAAGETEEQLPGQIKVYDYPELIPEGMKEGSHGEEKNEPEENSADTGDGSGTVSGSGSLEADEVPEPDEITGAAEDDGCTENPGDTGGQEEEKTWRDVIYELEAVKRHVQLCSHNYPELKTEDLRDLYRKTINLAAAVEEILIRSGKNEQKHHA